VVSHKDKAGACGKQDTTDLGTVVTAMERVGGGGPRGYCMRADKLLRYQRPSFPCMATRNVPMAHRNHSDTVPSCSRAHSMMKPRMYRNTYTPPATSTIQADRDVRFIHTRATACTIQGAHPLQEEARIMQHSEMRDLDVSAEELKRDVLTEELWVVGILIVGFKPHIREWKGIQAKKKRKK
jgi:hypothetical protein